MSKNHQNFAKKNKICVFFKILFLHDKKMFFIKNLFYDLEFSYAFDLAHFERPRGCTEVSETQKHDIVQISPGFLYPKKNNIAIYKF